MRVLEYNLRWLYLKPGVIFGIAATLPFLMFTHFDFTSMRDKQQIAFILLPMICGFLAGGLFGKYIKYNHQSIMGGVFKSLGWSLMIFISSICIWYVLAFFLMGPNSFAFGFLAITYLGALTYPPALMAGALVWLSEKYK